MFTLDNKYTFPADPKMCFLAGLVGFTPTAGMEWHLKLHSLSARTSLIQSEDCDERLNKLAFGIDCSNLRFPVTDWKDLRGSSPEVFSDSLSCAFQVLEWEDLTSLRLTFGETRSQEIEVFAEGTGLVESVPGWFGHSEVSLSIQTWARFLGVSIHVPVNASNFVAYAQGKLRNLLPGYLCGEPTERRAVDNSGTLRGVEVFYPPK
jgi:hypothetical protein